MDAMEIAKILRVQRPPQKYDYEHAWAKWNQIVYAFSEALKEKESNFDAADFAMQCSMDESN